METSMNVCFPVSKNSERSGSMGQAGKLLQSLKYMSPTSRLIFFELLHKVYKDWLDYSSMGESERKMWAPHYGAILKEFEDYESDTRGTSEPGPTKT